MPTALAVIMPLTEDDHGFGWGTDRSHYLLQDAADLDSLIDDWAGGGLDSDRRRRYDAESLWAEGLDEVTLAIQEMAQDQADVAEVDTDEGVTDSWPSAGGADHWTNDVWLGLADYLSAKQWAGMIGRKVDYTLLDADADACVRSAGLDAVRDALEYLSDSDPIYATLIRAVGEAAYEDDVAAHDHAKGDDSED